MSDDRYEIRSKIGQGGVGAVYRAFDRHLNREVAIKRVLPEGGYENQEEATKAMLNEAASLCSVQHPHIVTVFDAGVDNDGPYVVMELLSGRTIDEMIERGTLTFEDFREVAVQSQEALIAAQDLDLVHRDIKPTNVMVTWLPSGRFQVKIVDFGLAKFSPKPSLQTIDHGDSVFGSIHFMAPEQFERTPLDKRTDMYSMGCVYYYCLAGQYPFDGETAPQVMNAHLQHTVTPIEQLRPDLPEWLSKWVMWHLARNMEDRPRDAREALKLFLMSENGPGGAPEATAMSPMAIAPGAPPANTDTGPVKTHTAPQPIMPPEGATPSIHTSSQQVKASTSQVTVAAPVQNQEAQVTVPLSGVPTPPPTDKPALVAGVNLAAPTAAAPQFNTGAPVLQTGAAPIPAPGGLATPAAPAPGLGGAAAQLGAAPVQGTSVALPTQKSGMSNAAKGVIAAALAVGIIIAGIILMEKRKDNARTGELNEVYAEFANNKTPQSIDMDSRRVSLILETLSTPGETEEKDRPTLLTALNVAKETDGTDISALIAKYAAENDMDNGVRAKLFDVVRYRGEESALPHLIDYASKSDNAIAGRAALSAARKMANSSNFDSLLSIVNRTQNATIRTEAVKTLIAVVKDTEDTASFTEPIIASYKSTTNDSAKRSLLTVMGAAGGDQAADIVASQLQGDDDGMRMAAMQALRHWPDGSQFEVLSDYAAGEQNSTLRSKAFSAMIDFLMSSGERLDDDDKSLYWEDTAGIAAGESEQLQVVQAMARESAVWADDILDTFVESGDTDRVQSSAEEAKVQRAENATRIERGGERASSGDDEEEIEEDEEEVEEDDSEEEETEEEEEEE